MNITGELEEKEQEELLKRLDDYVARGLVDMLPSPHERKYTIDCEVHPRELRSIVIGREDEGYELSDHCIDGIYWTLLWERK